MQETPQYASTAARLSCEKAEYWVCRENHWWEDGGRDEEGVQGNFGGDGYIILLVVTVARL